jgi:hypothetical protein
LPEARVADSFYYLGCHRPIRLIFVAEQLETLARALPKAAWKKLERPAKCAVKTAPRHRPENIKEQIVKQRQFENIRLVYARGWELVIGAGNSFKSNLRQGPPRCRARARSVWRTFVAGPIGRLAFPAPPPGPLGRGGACENIRKH